MSRAKAMLANSQLSVGAIAELCGFGSSEQFSRMFRRSVGVSPREFRRSSG
jgi:AraC-like DNA-binding protein